MEANLLFGRGIKAGFDVVEQKQNAVQYDQLVHKYDPQFLEKKNQKKEEKINREKDNNREENKEERNKKKDIYDIRETDHWSKKGTKDMNERDWRIFREDNDIIIKGGRVPQPMRHWEEGSLPPFILDAVKRLKYEVPTSI
jgi:ATP-dependent RNA helicase DDX23/PRP28